MNFFYQGQIALRSALIDTLACITSSQTDESRMDALKREIESRKSTIARLSDSVVESIPMLICSTELHISGVELCAGKKIGQVFARAACWLLQQGERVPPRHKDFADKAILWLHRFRNLG